MNRDELIERHPQLFHMAEAGSWPGIREHGLITTEDLVLTAGLPAAQTDALLRERRSRSTVIEHPLYGRVVIRDQGPLNLSHLRGVLTDVTLEGWLQILNSRVFFWLHPDKLQQLLNARRYRQQPQDVITVDTRSLLDATDDRVRLSRMNSGATLYPSAPPRGSTTFETIENYDYALQRRRRGAVDAIVELAVVGGVADIEPHVLDVRRLQAGQVLQHLYP
ncbi:hypothetical protein PFZ49_07205 [Microbacterium lacticum]|uniref:DUF7002 family protein n=1 Tax=Microbacterium lacticum TaxID=33885 RepID=UPI003A86968F